MNITQKILGSFHTLHGNKNKNYIINSLLDNDFYKFTMMQAVLHKHPGVMVKYQFKDRNNALTFDSNYLPINNHTDVFSVNRKNYKKDEREERLKRLNNYIRFETRLHEEIRHLDDLRFTEDELRYLSNIRFFKPDFIEYLRLFKFNTENYVEISRNSSNNDQISFNIDIEGPWLSTILMEVPILAIISELYHTMLVDDDPVNLGKDTNLDFMLKGREDIYVSSYIPKAHELKLKYADFGTRRRFSKAVQEEAVFVNKDSEHFVGTSNVYFAKKYNLKPIGTMAHEWLQAHQQLGRLVDSQKAALENWAQEYRGELGIALSDVVGFDAFLRDFDLYFAKLFDGCRHDSGDPIKWCDKLINHYEKLGIDPKTKTAVFSDSINIETAYHILSLFNDRINISFGVGGNFTNYSSTSVLNMVIKMVECNGRPVCKLSDSKGKGMCLDDEYVRYVKKVFYPKKEILEWSDMFVLVDNYLNKNDELVESYRGTMNHYTM